MTNWPTTKGGMRARKPRYRIPKLAWVLVLPFGIFALPSLILLLVAALPTFGALISDRRPEKYAATCVGGFSLAATLPYLFNLWSFGGGMKPMIDLLSNVWMYLIIYLAAAVGWGVFYGLPLLMMRISTWHSEGQYQDLQKRKAEIIQEWGVDLVQEIEKVDNKAAS